jgi:transposase
MPCLLPRKNCSGHGFSAWARMLKWHKEHPGSFYKAYGRRSLVESGFSAVKGHFGHAVRCVTLEMQRRELTTMSICRNLLV